MILGTYRARIIFYNVLLTGFLVGILGYTYFYSRGVILEEAEIHSLNHSNLLRSGIEMEEEKLLHYTEIIRDDLIIQEYMFISTELGGEAEALWNLYRRSFGWLPVKHTVFIDRRGNPLIGNAGEDQDSLVTAINQRANGASEGIFYHQGKTHFELVTWARIYFQGTPRGIVALTHPIDRDWLSHHHFRGGYYLLIGEDGRTIELSDLPGSEGREFRPEDGLLRIDGKSYRVRPIPLRGEGQRGYRLWLAMSEQDLLDKLARHSRFILMLMFGGSLAVLVTGLLMARSFSRPLNQLMQITQAVTAGELPQLKKSSGSDEISVLVNRFSEMLSALRNKQEEIDRAHRQLEELAITDALTGLYNRHHLNEQFPKLLAQARREHKFLCVLLMDLDRFKQINDRYGHAAGDACLIHASQLLQTSSRASDYLFRVGGEEFLILSISDSPDGAQVLADKIRRAFEASPCQIEIDGLQLTVTTSIGVSCADDGRPADQVLNLMLSQADKALYIAKERGRNRVVDFADLPEEARDGCGTRRHAAPEEGLNDTATDRQDGNRH